MFGARLVFRARRAKRAICARSRHAALDEQSADPGANLVRGSAAAAVDESTGQPANGWTPNQGGHSASGILQR
jgi:hypothetical protein